MGSPASLPHLSLVFDQPWSGVGVASCTGLGSLTVRAALEGAGFASARGLALAIGLIGSWSSGAAAFLPHVGLLFGGPVGVLAATGVVSGSGLGSLTTRAAFVAFGTASATGLGVIGRGAQMPLPHLMSLGGASQAVSVEVSAAGRATAAGSAFLSGPFRSPDLLGTSIRGGSRRGMRRWSSCLQVRYWWRPGMPTHQGLRPSPMLAQPY